MNLHKGSCVEEEGGGRRKEGGRKEEKDGPLIRPASLINWN
jgi:hypothetical protein